MRIAHITWSLGTGGIQTMLTEIANIHAQEGHEVGIFVVDSIVSEYLKSKLDSRIKVFFMNRTRGKKQILPFIKLNWAIYQFKPNIIHSHAGNVAKVLLSKAPKIATIHGLQCNPRNYTRYQSLYAISKAIQQEWKENGIDYVKLIENGINSDSITIKKKFVRNKTIHIVIVSRIIFKVKGQDIVAHALAKVKKKIASHSNLNGYKFVAHFFGDGGDTERLRQLAIELNIEENIVIEGLRDRGWIFEHLCDYDLFVQASRREGFGLTVAEACAAKLPVLVSDIAGPMEIINNGKLGMWFKSEDAEDLAEKLLFFAINGYDRTQIEAAYNFTKQHYDIKKTAYKYLNEYKKYWR